MAGNADTALVGVIPIHMVDRCFSDDLVISMACKAILKSYVIDGMRYSGCGRFRNSGNARAAAGGGGGYDDYHCYG